ncbi:MAG: hypothetical protein LBP61_01700 [Desulfovibrio sp.]|jgi:hypothetical protein|nr:hypothetical protein [Desulfovibrio sp.]
MANTKTDAAAEAAEKKTAAEAAEKKAAAEAAEKKAAAEAAEKEAEALEKTNAAAEEDLAAVPGDVYVFANLKQDQSFRLSDGEVVTIRGFTVSGLRKPGGGFFAGGKYGVTPVPEDKWREVMRVYGKMKIFLNGLVFDAPSLERGQAMARERGGLRHGYEPVDPESQRTKTSPKAED